MSATDRDDDRFAVVEVTTGATAVVAAPTTDAVVEVAPAGAASPAAAVVSVMEVDVEDGEVKLFLVLVPHAATTTATATTTTTAAAFLAAPIRPTTGAMSPPPSAPPVEAPVKRHGTL